MLAAFRIAKTSEEMEAAISLFSDASTRLEDEEIKEINSICEKITFETTSKFRRRLKRFQEAIVEPKNKQHHSNSTALSQEDKKTTHQVMELVPIAESIVRLRNCKTWYDVEIAMNTLAVPTVEDGDTKKTELKEALKEVINQGNLATSKLLRRRISRLIFVLSNPEEKDEEKRIAKLRAQENIARVASQPPTRSTRTDTRSNETIPTGNRFSSSSSSSSLAVLPIMDINAALMTCLGSLEQATKTADIDTAVTLLPPTIVDLVVHVESNLKNRFVDKLTVLHDDSKLVSNAKLRRRIKRLIEMLLSSPIKEEDTDVRIVSAVPVPVPVPAIDKIKQLSAAKTSTAITKKRPLSEPEEDVASKPTTSAIGSFVKSLAALNTASTPTEFESCLNDLTMESEGTDDERTAFRDRLHAVLEKESCVEQQMQQDDNLIGNAKVRRKAKRLLDMLEARYPTAAAAAKSPPVVEEVMKKPVKEKKKKVPKLDLQNPPPGPPLDSALQHVSDMQAGLVTADDLVGETSVLMGVDEHSGNNRSRRLLKRALERVLADDDLMNPRIRRKLTDIVIMLTPKSNPVDNAAAAAAATVKHP